MKTLRLFLPVLLIMISSGLLWSGQPKNEKDFGVFLGDPVAISVKLPVSEQNFWDLRAGVWTWHFWHDQNYNTPYLSVDYDWFFPLDNSFHYFYAGLGLAVFLSDNPKDENDYDACAAIRFPVGRQLYKSEKEAFSVNFEFAPIYQFAPPYSAKPYIFELNAGIILRHSFD